MLTLGTPRIPKHELFHEVRRHTTRIPHHILRDLQRLGQHVLRPIHDLTEQPVPHLVARQVRRTRRDGLHGATVPDKPGQEEGTTRLHDEAAAGEDEAYFRAFVCDADVHGQRHCDADADGGALKSADGGLAAVEDGEGYTAASVNSH